MPRYIPAFRGSHRSGPDRPDVAILPDSTGVIEHGGKEAVPQNKCEELDEGSNNRDAGRLVMAETVRSSAESSAPGKPGTEQKEEEHMSLFWRVFGGTILSIAALVVITLYNNLATGISDLRSDVSREREARAELVKKDDFNTRSANLYERIRSLDALKAEQEGLRERITASAASVDALKKDTGTCVEAFKKEVGLSMDALKKDTVATVDGLKKEIAGSSDALKKDEAMLEVLRERVNLLEPLKKDVAGIDGIKEKLATAMTDMKLIRDDIFKLQQEAERNRAADIERKSNLDLHCKQMEETLKELQKGLQNCREKLARLEGAQPAGGRTEVVPDKKQ
jgi:hypothetical protein